MKKKPCPKCRGWGVMSPHSYEILPCPKCGMGRERDLKLP